MDGRDQFIITCLEYIREYLMKRIVVVQQVIGKTVGPLSTTVTLIFDVIMSAGSQYNVDQNGGSKYQVKGPCDCNTQHTENGMGVGILENWVHATYRLETWAHLSRKRKSIKCSLCGNLGHNMKGCNSQGGARNGLSQGTSSSQQSATPSQATGPMNGSNLADGSNQPSTSPRQAIQGQVNMSN
ncbi:hypothetical protein Tco_1240668 [Tanacetum coccineum]